MLAGAATAVAANCKKTADLLARAWPDDAGELRAGGPLAPGIATLTAREARALRMLARIPADVELSPWLRALLQLPEER